MSQRNDERNARICELREAGRALEQIGEQFGITRERVRQILKRRPIVVAQSEDAKQAIREPPP
jgi:predicted transcriptional regulator